MDDEIMETLHEDIVFNSRFNNSEVINRLGSKDNQYGERMNVELIIKSNTASSLAELAHWGESHVATGIALGIELGRPMFEKIGEDFLKSKIANYKNSDLGVALTKVMLDGIQNHRAELIVDGVKHLLDGNEPSTEAEKAAKLAIALYDITNKLPKNERKKAFSNYYYDALTQTEENKTVSFAEDDDFKKLKNMESKKDLICWDPQKADELEQCFQYYISDISKLPEEFLRALKGYPKEEIVAYYVMSISEYGIRRICENMKKESNGQD